ncbi:hypothetical protein MRX96_029564 [Rhipicephalus microplus]
MQPTARTLRPILPKPAKVGHGSLTSDESPVQSNNGLISFSLNLVSRGLTRFTSACSFNKPHFHGRPFHELPPQQLR